MVSALRQRAAQSPGLPAGDDAVEFTTPLRASRPRPSPRRRPRWLDWRRFGLGVSIAGAMGASAIGGVLFAKAGPATLPAAALPAPRAAASAAAHAASAAPAASAASTHAAASAPAVERAVPAASAAASSAHAADAPVPPPAPTLATDLTFGLDLNGDGIPDSLERFVRKTINSPATRVAARQYYRLALPLATRVEQGDTLPHADKQSVFRAAECYFLAAAEDGVADAPNLNDRASLIGAAAADRMHALAEALQGFDYRVGADKRKACN